MFRRDKRKQDSIRNQIEYMENSNRRLNFMPKSTNTVYVWSGNVTLPVCMKADEHRR